MSALLIILLFLLAAIGMPLFVILGAGGLLSAISADLDPTVCTTLRYTHITDRLVQNLVSPLDMIHPAP